MVKSMLKVHKSIDILKYDRLTSYFKVGLRNYKPKNAKVLERNQIEQFLKKAPNEEYLQASVCNYFKLCIELFIWKSLKVVTIMNVAGA